MKTEQLKSLQEKTKSFPKSPGVYLMKNQQGKIIYVGKAKNLRNRVRQYFNNHDNRYQISFLMSRLASVDFLQTFLHISVNMCVLACSGCSCVSA